MDSFEDYIDYRWPAALLATALGAKLLARSKPWTNPLLRAVVGLLVLAVAVCVFVTPGMIVRVNRVTGVPNLAAPWVYTLLTALSFACLLLIIAWQRGMEKARGTVRWMTVAYAAVAIALWVLFVLADTGTERVRDFDTYYATTPYARELIVLYLLAHTAAGAVASLLIWGWLVSREHAVRSWLLGGLLLLGTGYVANLVFDAFKLTAVTARWAGHDLDWCSTKAAPAAGALSAILIGLGFLLPHVGEDFRRRRAARATYRRLEPLHRLLGGTGASTGSSSTRWANAYLALARRDTRIRDGILRLEPYLDRELWERAREETFRHGAAGKDADGIAGAVVLTAALGARGTSPPRDDALDPRKLLSAIHAIADALRHPGIIEKVRRQCAASTGSTHTS
ncbi:MAG TPA: DUF6545 domain-containing protein [Streptomyces sp.]|uniref:DUF6545 domain-containing protein n=1 Tax=Streptomyces sp. TaxID=1931 RepID=UPI002D45BE23|nr:DUF6545 domain-containing protein [Streptomyces sp.]HZG07267.1 DUF6545 domain-containing protein [Streptomyces sp.]